MEGGSITLNDAASNIVVGLAYEVIIETMALPPEERKKLTGEITLDLVESFDVYAGRDEDKLVLVNTRDAEYIGAPILYTGQPEGIRPEALVDTNASIVVKQAAPYPFTLTALYYGVKPT